MTVIGFLLFLATVATFGKEGNLRLQTAFTSAPQGKFSSSFNFTSNPIKDPNSIDQSSPEFICNNFDLVQLFANVSSVDTVGGTMKLHFLFFPCGKFISVDPVHGRSNIAVNMNITIDSKVFRFADDLPMSSQDIVTRFARGDVNNYPIETYESNAFQISGSYFPETSSNVSSPVPIRLSIVGALQTFSIDIPEVIDVSETGDGTLLSVRVRVRRSFTTRAFSIFVMGVMWVLSILTFCLSVSPWIRNYKAEAPTLAIPNTLLFALPAIRNSQPGVPAIGATVDVVSFFWCEMLTAVSSLIMLTNYILYTYYPPKPRTPTPAPPPPEPETLKEPVHGPPVNAEPPPSSRRRNWAGSLRRRGTESDAARRRTRFSSVTVARGAGGGGRGE
ncbi:hypothetical protein BC829DRAFT_476506 [Chytridium lagenaria]|nr:hypothetical protein BC829DRAFT_476506 [Chytridium lagenaria]